MNLTKHGNNADIKINILPEKLMRLRGFTDYRKGHWYFCKKLDRDISFNLSVNKEDSSDWQIDILDDNFCQPYDYQYYVRETDLEYARQINEKVECVMKWLTAMGIVEGWQPGDYI